MIDNSELLEHWTELFIGYLNGTLSESEAAEFEELTRDPHFEALREQLTTSGYIAGRMAEYDGFDAARLSDASAPPRASANPPARCARWAVAATGIAAAVVVAAESRSSPVRRRASANARCNWPTPSTPRPTR